jgi:hypothetical protein
MKRKRAFIWTKRTRKLFQAAWLGVSASFLLVLPCAAGRRAEFAGTAHVADAKVGLLRGGGIRTERVQPDLSIHCGGDGRWPWRLRIVSSVFWIGETGSGPTNARSAWDAHWVENYGGVDDPKNRAGYIPAKFSPRSNPFYVALPYNDVEGGRLKSEASKVVPWFVDRFSALDKSVCKDRWVAIRHGDRVCYAQWEDAGPFRTDDTRYVFGDARPAPNSNHGAGIDVSPAVRDFLGLGSLDVVDWKFVDSGETEPGPWLGYVQSPKAVFAANHS